jgi:hypothetical protein
MNNKNYISFNGSRTDFETTDFFEDVILGTKSALRKSSEQRPVCNLSDDAPLFDATVIFSSVLVCHLILRAALYSSNLRAADLLPLS